MAKILIGSGKIILFILALTISSVFGETKLSSSTVRMGEPLEIRIDVKDAHRADATKQVFVQDGIRAEYSGIEERTEFVNSQKYYEKVIKYVIVPKKPGKFLTPDIELNLDGKIVHSGRFPFTVLNEKYKQQTVSPFDSFFSFGNPVDYNISPENTRVKFYTDRKEAYIGEAITGYFLLLHQSGYSPEFQRNPKESVSFPWFLSETLQGGSVNSPQSLLYEGKNYNVTPYNSEIFILTPLKAGVFQIGGTDFIVSSGPFSQSFAIEAIEAEVKIKELPEPAPPGFTGEVGNYDVTVEMKDTGTLSEGLPLKVRIIGEGSASLFKDPAKEICQDKKCRAVLNYKDIKKKFGRLQSGNYGLLAEAEFDYVILPEVEGKLELNDLHIVFFHPSLQKYTTRTIQFKPVEIVSEEPHKSKEDTVNAKKTIPGWLQTTTLILLLTTVLWVFVKKYGKIGLRRLSEFQKNITGPFLIKFTRKIPVKFHFGKAADLNALDKWLGSKKGLLLKNYLIEKGIHENDSLELVALKAKYGNRPFQEVVDSLNETDVERLKMIQKRILEEHK